MIRDDGDPLDLSELRNPWLWITAVLLILALGAFWWLLVALATPAPQ